MDLDSVRYVGNKTFYRIQGRWVDGEFREGMKTVRVTFLSDEYFQLLQKQPELKPFLSLGERVLVVLADKTAVDVEP